jgi:L-ascorbate metabolism protein UlaG (beta-lactamase superfamily)
MGEGNMKQIGLAFLVLGSAVGLSVAGEQPAQVTYIANEGFIVEVGAQRIVIDGLFFDATIDFCDAPTPVMREQMENASGPFKNVDLLLFTHRHRDHFTAGVVVKHLLNNPRAIVVGPPQVITDLRRETGWTAALEERAKETRLDLFASSELEVHGITIRASRLRHGVYLITDEKTGEERNKHENVENLAYLVEISGAKFVHIGDAFLRENSEFFDHEFFAKQKIDLVFMEGWSDESLALLDEWMSPGEVVFMHLPADKERVDLIADYIHTKLPNAMFFGQMMEKKTVLVGGR